MGQAGDNAGAACSLPFITAGDRPCRRGGHGLLHLWLPAGRPALCPFCLANVLMWPNGAVFGRETGMAEGIRGLFRGSL